MLQRVCKQCEKEFEVFPCRIKNGWAITCSRRCAMLLRPIRYWVGKKMSKQHREKLSQAYKQTFRSGRKQWNLGLRGWNSGEKNPMWKGGVSSINARLRSSVDFRIWRTAVFIRDNYTCQECGVRGKKGKRIELNADHIKPWSKYPELRFEITNGRTMCINCHKKTDTYGRKLK